MSSRIVLIGPADGLPSLQERLDPSADVQTFTDGEAVEALKYILLAPPALVAMHAEFADSPRGQALMTRIKGDAVLSGVEVRVMAKSGSQHRLAVKRGSHGSRAVAAVDQPTRTTLDQHGTRRAPRTRIKDGVEISLDGHAAVLIDLSTVGAQIVSATALKPNQRVRVIIGEGRTSVKCAGEIAWAAFEMPKDMPTRYRAGIDWGVSADVAGLERFIQKHKKG